MQKDVWTPVLFWEKCFFSSPEKKHLQGADWSRNTKWQLDYEKTSILYLLCSGTVFHQWTFTFYLSFLFLVSWLGFPPVEVFSFYKWSKFSGFVPSAIPTVITKEGLRYLMYNVFFNQKNIRLLQWLIWRSLLDEWSIERVRKLLNTANFYWWQNLIWANSP